MNMLNNEQQGSLSEKFQGFGAAPSDALWGNIAEAITEKKKRKVAYWWWIGAGTAAAVLITIFSINGSKNSEETALASTIVTAKAEKRELNSPQNLISSHAKNAAFNEFENDFENTQNISKNDSYPTIYENYSRNDLVETNEAIQQVQLIDEKAIAETIEMDKFVEFLPNPSIDLLEAADFQPKIQLLEFRDHYKYRPWEIGFNVGYYTRANFDLALKKENTYDPTPLTNQESMTDEFILGQQPENFGTSTGMAYNSNFTTMIPSTQSTVTKNFNFNLYAGRYVSDRFMINTGFGYSRSTYRTIYNNGFTTSPITHITTLMIPVGLSIDAVQLPKFKLRPTLSLNNEFAVYEKVQTVELMPYEFLGNRTSGYSASLEVSVNHLFRLRPRLALDVAPSFRYYLRQNIQSQNFLIKENAWIGGKAGLIWTL